MAIVNKPDMTNLWASGGAIIAPSASKVQKGWTAEIPPHQWENWVQNRQDEAIAYLFQKGIVEWDSATEYQANKSFVSKGGTIYVALTTNTNKDPEIETNDWKRVGLTLDDLATVAVTGKYSDLVEKAPDASTTTKGLVELATNAETITGTDTARAVTPAGLTSRTALESRTGLVQLATTAEAQALTNDTKALTPKKLGDALQPHTSGSATFTRSSNQIVLTGIVTALALEVGDVIQITGSANNNRLHTVESITDNNTIIVNYEHRNGAGSLSLVDETTNVTIKRIAKWFNAPIGLGQAWVDVKSFRSMGTYYKNDTNRMISVFRLTSSSLSSISLSWDDGVSSLPTHPEGAQTSPFSYEVPAGWSHRCNDGGDFTIFWELR